MTKPQKSEACLPEITKERADELDAAWQAASPTQRLLLNRVSWINAGDGTRYFEEKPTKLELAAAERIAELKADLERVLDKYDEENPARLADYHLTGCDCMRCRIDDARATLKTTH